MNTMDGIQQLLKALEAGSYNAAPSTLVQGAALQVEDLSPVLHNVCFSDEHVKLQKELKVESVKSMLAQFDRQLSYGMFGGSAQWEGNVGQEETSDYARVVVPMAMYSHLRRVTIASTMVATVDGKKSDERAAADAAKKIAADVEFDLFRGFEAFSNAGVFDGHPGVIPNLPNIQGLDLQIRQSDSQKNAKDLMFAEYGSDETVVIAGGGVLSQENVQDSYVRSQMNFGQANKLLLDPITLGSHNKLLWDKQRIMLAGSPQTAAGTDMAKMWVSGGTVSFEASRFLSGKTQPQGPRLKVGAPSAPTISTGVTASQGTAFLAGQAYTYYVTAANEIGESIASNTDTETINADGDRVNVTITHGSGTTRYFNVYRGLPGQAAARSKFIGRIAAAAGATTTFRDLGNKIPGFVTGYLVETDTMAIKELAPYSRTKLAQADLSMPEAHFRFCTLAVTEPRKNCLIDNLR